MPKKEPPQEDTLWLPDAMRNVKEETTMIKEELKEIKDEILQPLKRKPIRTRIRTRLLKARWGV